MNEMMDEMKLKDKTEITDWSTSMIKIGKNLLIRRCSIVIAIHTKKKAHMVETTPIITEWFALNKTFPDSEVINAMAVNNQVNNL